MDLLDTAGQEEYSSLREMVSGQKHPRWSLPCRSADLRTDPTPRQPTTQYIRSSDCYVIVYDITSRSSFEEARLMRDFILRVRDEEMVYIVKEQARCRKSQALLKSCDLTCCAFCLRAPRCLRGTNRTAMDSARCPRRKALHSRVNGAAPTCPRLPALV